MEQSYFCSHLFSLKDAVGSFTPGHVGVNNHFFTPIPIVIWHLWMNRNVGLCRRIHFSLGNSLCVACFQPMRFLQCVKNMVAVDDFQPVQIAASTLIKQWEFSLSCIGCTNLTCLWASVRANLDSSGIPWSWWLGKVTKGLKTMSWVQRPSCISKSLGVAESPAPWKACLHPFLTIQYGIHTIPDLTIVISASALCSFTHISSVGKDQRWSLCQGGAMAVESTTLGGPLIHPHCLCFLKIFHC